MEDNKPKRSYNKKNRIEPPKADKTVINNHFVNPNFYYPVSRHFSKGVVTEKDEKSKELVTKRYAYNKEHYNYTKVFTTPATRDIIDALDIRAKELFLYIMYRIEPGTDCILIDREKYMKIAKLKSLSVFLKAVDNLEDAGLIKEFKSQKNLFAINPFYFYNGNRLKSYELHMRVEYDQVKDDFAENLEKRKKEKWGSSYKSFPIYIKDNPDGEV